MLAPNAVWFGFVTFDSPDSTRVSVLGYLREGNRWPKPASDTASFRLGVHVYCRFQGTEEKRVDSLTLGDVGNVSTLLNMNGVRLGERQRGSKKVAFCQAGFPVSILGADQ